MTRFGEETYRDIKAFEALYRELVGKVEHIPADAVFFGLGLNASYAYDTWIPRFLENSLNATIIGLPRGVMDFALDKLVDVEKEVDALVKRFGVAA